MNRERKCLFYSEAGVTLIELLGSITLFGILTIFLGTILSTALTAEKKQKERLISEETANLIAAQIIKISENDALYKVSGYQDNPNDPSWSALPSDWDKHQMLVVENNGSSKIGITDLTDVSKKRLKVYCSKIPGIKINVEQKKNENAKWATNETAWGDYVYLPNYRDTFTVQSTITIEFKKEKKTIYSRKVNVEYRDEDKASGEIGGEGWW